MKSICDEKMSSKTRIISLLEQTLLEWEIALPLYIHLDGRQLN